VFIANPERKEKNYVLAKQSVEALRKTGYNVSLLVDFGKDCIDHEIIPYLFLF
jgi:hypothetical protein